MIKEAKRTTSHTSPNKELEAFEASFSYPLNEKESFRISHGNDYSLFFSSMGDSKVIIARREEKLTGIAAACIRELTVANNKTTRCAYLGDLKFRTQNQSNGRLLLNTLKELQTWCETQTDSGIAVVMEGTKCTPEQYSGRLGIRSFCRLGQVHIFRIPVIVESHNISQEATETTRENAEALAVNIPRHYNRFSDSTDPKRSLIRPIYLRTISGNAACRLEDTRAAKRLYKDDGSEMLNCHLSDFHYIDKQDALALIEKAKTIAHTKGFTGIFMSLDSSRALALSGELAKLDCSISNAIVYGTGTIATTGTNSNWYINSSEI